jgi:cysteine desulfurase
MGAGPTYPGRVSVYLDHAAGTPMRPAALAAMTRELAASGNPSSLHGSGRRARRVLEEARELIAERLGATPHEVVLTAGGTEADNLAVKGAYWARHQADPARDRLLVSAVEHHAVLDPAGWLAGRGARVEHLPVDGSGRLDLDRLAIDERVALVSVMWANNEVGTVQPVPAVVAAAAGHGVPVHADAVQAAGWLPVDFAASGLDLLTVSAHKVGGPVGAGALLVRRGTALTAVLHGGGQERSLRSGTPDAAGALGFAVALDEAVRDREVSAVRVAALRDRLLAGVLAAVPDAMVSGHPEHRLPGVAHLVFPGCEGDSLLYLLDAAGIECSTGSACQAGVARPSHVVLATGLPEDRARGALRFSLGWSSTEADVDALLAAIGEVVERARRAGLSGSPTGSPSGPAASDNAVRAV